MAKNRKNVNGFSSRGPRVVPSSNSSRNSGKAPMEPVQMPSMWKIQREIQDLLSQHTLWKDKNQQEREKIAQLGGRNLKHGLSGGNSWDASQSLTTTKSGESKRKPKDRALKCTGGHFRGGVLNVKHLLQPNSPSREGGDNTIPTAYNRKGKKGKGGGKKKGKVRREESSKKGKNQAQTQIPRKAVQPTGRVSISRLSVL
ncbi:hypothetical protein CRG98_002429 [Punica granatum]|uniref:Uncharacterized protein n=1 Tax=Punica granatum TaxID=22663 RepID=A0A2I0L948_PUNGR|nr:hypothetical protein CRG98_002429 [Punica granatum]